MSVNTTATTNPTRTPDRRRSALGAATAALVGVLLLAGCRAEPSAEPPAVATAAPREGVVASEAPATDVASESPTSPETPSNAPASVARASAKLRVYDAPGDQTPARTLAATTDFGTPTVVLVSKVGTGASAGWLEVLLPVRPNGTTGWIRAGDVELRDVTLAIEIDLQARELTVSEDGDVLLTTPTAIGDPDHPTPTGQFYVVDKLETPDPGGAYGPYALGLSARSEVLTEFGGGDGQVGIHGTNVPTSIGQPVSHGCLRVGNDVIERLVNLLPLGTPVTIS